MALRAGILSTAAVVVSGLFVSGALKAGSMLVRSLVGLFLLVLTGGVLTYEAKKVQRRLATSL